MLDKPEKKCISEVVAIFFLFIIFYKSPCLEDKDD